MPVLRPADGDVLLRNTECVVAWRYTDPSSHVAPTVDIELQCATTGRPLRTIATDVCNQGSYFWTIGATVPVGGPYRLFIGNLLENGSFHDTDDNSACMDTRDDADGEASSARDVERMYSGLFRVGDANATKKQDRGATPTMMPQRRFFSSFASSSPPLSAPQAAQAVSIQDPIRTTAVDPPQPQRPKPQQCTSPLPDGNLATASTDDNRTTLCAHIYARVAMDTGTVRRALQRIRQEPPVTVDTNLNENDDSMMRAGAFAVRYLLFRYYKKQLMQCNASLESSILHLINTNQRDEALSSTLLPDSLAMTRLLREVAVPDEYQPNRAAAASSSSTGSNSAAAAAASAAALVICGGGTARIVNDTQALDDDQRGGGDSSGSSGSGRQVQSCVEGVSIRREREYLQRIRCWSLNVDEATLVDASSGLGAEQFALSYVYTDRCKRTENTRRSKHRRRQMDQS